MAERRMRESYDEKIRKLEEELKLANEKCQQLTRVLELYGYDFGN